MASSGPAKAAVRLSELIGRTLSTVRGQITTFTAKAGRSTEPRLVAVSKTKGAHYVKAAYDHGHRIFGENYVQELVEKAPLLPGDIEWHFIGHLQRNKCKQLLSIPNLAMVETVDSAKLATDLDKACQKVGRKKLRVMVQVNTSGESSKFGCEPSECTSLVRHVHQTCKSLEFTGLMTIGRYDENPKPDCFASLVKCREAAAAELKVPPTSLELSMGMSADLELSIAMGSTYVRVGTAIFGVRDEKLIPPDELAAEVKEGTYSTSHEPRSTLVPDGRATSTADDALKVAADIAAATATSSVSSSSSTASSTSSSSGTISSTSASSSSSS